MINICIKNGRIIDPANNIDAQQDIYIAQGKIIALGKAPDGFKAEQIIDAAGQIVIPGLVDMCAQLREPGQEYKGTIASETLAAVSAGITTLCCPPDTKPPIDHPAIAEFIFYHNQKIGNARLVTLGALTKGLAGEQLAEMAALKKAGCVGVSNARKPITNTKILQHCYEYAAAQDLTVFINAQDHELAADGCVHEGAVSTRLGLPGIPETAETVAIARDLLLIERAGTRAHFSQLSSGRAVELIAAAQKRGLKVTADVAVHHLHLSELDISNFNTACHVQPPLRTLRDQELLRLGIKQGIINAICSDHQPHELDAKLVPFAESAAGISGLATLLPLTLRLAHENFITLNEAIALLTVKPAKILGIDAGQLKIGNPADICIFDLDKEWLVNKDAFVSKGHNTPFHGWELRGKVTRTLLAGKIVYSA